jgi:hypothetical protein
MFNNTSAPVVQNRGAAIAAGAASAGSGLLGSIASIFNTQKQLKAQREMSALAYDRDVEMWNRMNEYNAPAAQMERLKAAGLNPNLVYGKGAQNVATQMPKYQAPKQEYNYEAPELGLALEQYQNMRLRQAQTDNLQTQNRLNDARVGTEVAKQSQVIADTNIKKLRHGLMSQYDAQYMESRNRQIQQAVDNLITRHAILGHQRTQAKHKARSAELQVDIDRFRRRLAEKDMTPSDSIWFRMMQRGSGEFQKLIDAWKKAVEKGRPMFNPNWNY